MVQQSHSQQPLQPTNVSKENMAASGRIHRGLPIGIRLLEFVGCCPIGYRKKTLYKYFILILTFFCYLTYHMSRKPISIVKPVLRPTNMSCHTDSGEPCGWDPFNQSNSKKILGSLDYAYLFSYAIFMFISGHIAERVNLRYFLAIGMFFSGLFTSAFGLAFYLDIHNIAFFIIIQILTGIAQCTGWPAVIVCISHWFGKSRRGFIFGIWNSNISIGNILGGVIASMFVSYNWGLSFIVPGAIIAGTGIIVFFVLIPNPEDVGYETPSSEDQSIELEHIKYIKYGFDADSRRETIKPSTIGESRELPEHNNNSDLEGNALSTGNTSTKPPPETVVAVSIWRALKIPGVIEFSLCLLCAKLVNYTFLYWLPTYIKEVNEMDADDAGYMSTLFDVGGIVGGIISGICLDKFGSAATICVIMLTFACPMMWVYYFFSHLAGYYGNVALLMTLGFLVNSPYVLIATAVSATLGTHDSIKTNSRALATVTAIIDGTGSIGAAVGPLLAGVINSWEILFYTLMSCNLLAALSLSRVMLHEIIEKCRKCKIRRAGRLNC